LAECVKGEGNFKALCKQVLEKLDYEEDLRKTYTFQTYNFHVYISQSVCFLCMAKDSLGTRIPFGFLEDVRVLWMNKYGAKGQTAIEYGMNDEFSRVLGQKMDFYSNDTSADKIRAINAQMEVVKKQMKENVEKVMERSENIEELVDKAQGLQTETNSFNFKATTMKRKLWWKNIKLYVILAVVLLIIAYVAAGFLCGFPIFATCINTLSNGNNNSTSNTTNPPPPPATPNPPTRPGTVPPPPPSHPPPLNPVPPSSAPVDPAPPTPTDEPLLRRANEN